jgi:hypothetical protein
MIVVPGTPQAVRIGRDFDFIFAWRKMMGMRTWLIISGPKTTITDQVRVDVLREECPYCDLAQQET